MREKCTQRGFIRKFLPSLEVARLKWLATASFQSFLAASLKAAARSTRNCHSPLALGTFDVFFGFFATLISLFGRVGVIRQTQREARNSGGVLMSLKTLAAGVFACVMATG